MTQTLQLGSGGDGQGEVNGFFKIHDSLHIEHQLCPLQPTAPFQPLRLLNFPGSISSELLACRVEVSGSRP